ncbi:MAG: M81 family metallopeptidase [Deltaproteobacteria bacterium]|nr:M81 family metallopeptidase [Deltaproteobacteria bacterium]
MPRIAYARIAQEGNAFSPVRTEVEDFARCHLHEGRDLHERCSAKGQEVDDWLKNAELSGFVDSVQKVGRGRVEAVPLFGAWAIPGGPLSVACFEHFRDKLVAMLKAAGPLDGVFLSMHGAMIADGSDDPEADYVHAVREAMGPDFKIGVSLDLHAQLHGRFVDEVDVMGAYRTNPHRDHAKTGFRTGDMLVRTVLGEIKPTTAWRSLPLVCGGGTTIDFLPTMRPVYRWMKRQEKNPKVLYVSMFNAHLWNDSPDLGWAAHVVTDNDPALAEAVADELAEMLWEVRHKQPPHFPDADETMRLVRSARLRRKVGTVCVCDASDIVGCGAAGENTRLLKTILEQGQGLKSYVPVRDHEVVSQLFGKSKGESVDVTVGGKLHPAMNSPIRVRGTMLASQERSGLGRTIALDLDHVKLVVTEGPAMAMKPDFYRDLGLEPWRADMVVVKSMFPFRLYFAGMNRKTIYARTKGVTDFDTMNQVDFNDPVFPKNQVADWRPTDRKRRGLLDA